MNGVFKNFVVKDVVCHFQTTQKNKYDINVIVYNRNHVKPNGNVYAAQVRHSSRHVGYLPTAFLLALILSAGIPWKRKLIALLWGMLSIHLFILFKTSLIIIYFLGENEWIIPFKLTPFWKTTWGYIYEQFIHNLNPNFIVCLLIWILVVFRKEDYQKVVRYVKMKTSDD